jgi:hypothetical protein
MTKNLKKITAEKNFFSKNYNLPFPTPLSKTSKLQKQPSALKRGHTALQNMKFFKFFLLSWVIFAHLDPDPIGIRIRNRIIRNPAYDGNISNQIVLSRPSQKDREKIEGEIFFLPQLNLFSLFHNRTK